jgi:hypothetical protein
MSPRQRPLLDFVVVVVVVDMIDLCLSGTYDLATSNFSFYNDNTVKPVNSNPVK